MKPLTDNNELALLMGEMENLEFNTSEMLKTYERISDDFDIRSIRGLSLLLRRFHRHNIRLWKILDGIANILWEQFERNKNGKES